MTKSFFKLQENVPLAPLTTFKIGGKARFFASVGSVEELLKLVAWATQKKIDFRVIGGGSNLLVSDKGFGGLVIRFLGGGVKIKNNRVTAEGGALLSYLVKKTIEKGLGGLQSLVGIPGTVGGAIVGNAGAFGASISDRVEKVEIWDGKERRWLTKKGCRFDYRESIFKEKAYLVLRASFALQRQESKSLLEQVQKVLRKRRETCKSGLSCPGSFFKNVLTKDLSAAVLAKIAPSQITDGKIAAGYLLEKAGAKGMRVGEIKVANFHANFLLNRGRGKAADVLKLASSLKAKVKKKFGIKLQEEVEIV
jgi:UDP-N-acetylmuramate dehydrogenase